MSRDSIWTRGDLVVVAIDDLAFAARVLGEVPIEHLRVEAAHDGLSRRLLVPASACRPLRPTDLVGGAR